METERRKVPRFVVRDMETGLLLQQSAATGWVIGWTPDPHDCRAFPSREAAQASIERGKLIRPVVVLPLSVFL